MKQPIQLAATLAACWNLVLAAQKPLLSNTGIGDIDQPSIGFGTWRLTNSNDNTTESVSFAIETGYRQIDCAAIYGNEKAVGKGIEDGLKKANITRDQIWITSKLWNNDHGGFKTVEAALNQTLQDLNLEYLDLYLMHWPVGKKSKLDYAKTWKAMTSLPKDKVRNIGVSNFSPHQLRKIISKTGKVPFAHQMELHPYLQQSAWIKTHQALGIKVTAYSSLGNANPIYDKKGFPPLLKNDVIVKIAAERNCTPAQVALAWGISTGSSVIPKSSHKEYIKQNLEALECDLNLKDLAEIKLIEKDYVKRFSNPSKSWKVKLFKGLEDA